jgi:type II secretory pathway predicted ATPase ExeA
MIKAFFGLTNFPFSKDIEDIFISRQLAYLQARGTHFLETQGIALITGEAGSGKTTFIRKFTASLNHNSYSCFYLSNTVHSMRGFLRSMASALGLKPVFFTDELISQVKSELTNIYSKQRIIPILVIDEAQNLSDQALEQIRLMTNFNMDSKNCVAVFLLGHPVLKARLKLSPYAALKQRISFSCQLTGLEQDEINPYIIHRIKLAGCSKPLFTDDAVTLMFNYSKGLPRLINTIAHEALYVAAEQKVSLVDDKLVEGIIQSWDNL